MALLTVVLAKQWIEKKKLKPALALELKQSLTQLILFYLFISLVNGEIFIITSSLIHKR
jgi:hypothetical protein